ncbi:MAG TPA: lysophospholipid acyltransferase family protein [Tepidisphaeraceae bacterium]|jgi:1-acyl-sn-glycerol-3-phosphate acyltransferase|nr:lysophospholipid acyltransferase family protein [Tepidisphaeraceae bacterium]
MMEPWKLQPARDFGLPLSQRLRSVNREPGLIDTALHVLWWRIVRIYLVLAHRLCVEGWERLPPEPPFILVSNHQSHLDALVLAAMLPWQNRIRTYPIAAMDTFFESPLTAAFAASTINALPMQRGKAAVHALDDLRTRLIEERCIYILFPEGTRSRDGTMAPFKPGVGMFLAGTDVPVIPCHLHGTFEALPPKRRVPRPTPIRLKIGEPMRFQDVPRGREGWTQIAAALESAVRSLAEKPG